MEKKKTLVVVLLAVIMLASGCGTKQLKNSDGKPIKSDSTGQALTANILCLPESEELLSIYEENKDNLKVDFDSLKSCSEYKPRDIKYNGLWESIFVKPLAWLIIKLGILVKNYGLSVMIMGILIRLILMPFTKKTMMQSENMKKAQPELQAIQKKYENAKDQQSSMMMSQELMAVYKKYNVNPAGGCLISFLQFPILLAFLEAINRVPAIFEGSFLTLQLGTTPTYGIKNGNWAYIILILFIIGTTYFSYKNSMSSSTGNSDQDKQMGMMMKFMIVFISIASLSLPTALGLYWIVTNGFMIIQNMFIKKISSNKERTTVVKSIKTKGGK